MVAADETICSSTHCAFFAQSMVIHAALIPAGVAKRLFTIKALWLPGEHRGKE